MPIEFQCSCGKTLRAKDGSEGKQVKCPACQQLVTVPSGLGFADAEAAAPAPASGAPCPNCGEAMAEGAVVCMKCGFNTQTGAAMQTADDARDEERPRTIVFPVGKVITIAVIALVVAAGYFLVIRPLAVQHKMSKAYRFVRIGDMEGALKAFEELRPELRGRYRDKLDLWDSQCRLEFEKNTRPVLSQGLLVSDDALEMSLETGEPAGGAVIVKVTVHNKSEQPLTLKNDFFYLRGVRDIVPVSSHADNSLDGVVVPPGETRQGIVAFRSVPHDPVMVRAGLMQQPTFHLYFNDGTRYVKRILPAAPGGPGGSLFP